MTLTISACVFAQKKKTIMAAARTAILSTLIRTLLSLFDVYLICLCLIKTGFGSTCWPFKKKGNTELRPLLGLQRNTPPVPREGKSQERIAPAGTSKGKS
jgi:hypothetical protein